ncbi:MAG: hypothetical protein M1383_05105 [Patescibacteria group bacterium]|nr:hypothetical protein [Patescibacteria group bacterium]
MQSEIGPEIYHQEPLASGQKTLGREFRDIEFLDDEQIAERTEGLFDDDVNSANQNSEELLNYIAGFQGVEIGRVHRLQNLDAAISNTMDKHKGPNWNTLALLSEIEPSRPSVYAHFKILDALERHPDFLTPQIREHVERLAADPNPESQVAVHKFCDFLSGLAITAQFQEHPSDASEQRQQVLLDAIYDFAAKQSQKTQNYLLASHWEDIVETLKGRFSKKQDKISGVPGESSDYIIMTYNEFVLLQSYYNSLMAGKDHFDPEQPLIPVTQGYFGQYKRGQLQEVLTEDCSQLDQAYEMDKKLAAQNDQADNWIYARLNRAPADEQTWVLSDFFKKLGKKDREFYFNIINDDLDDPYHPNTKWDVSHSL